MVQNGRGNNSRITNGRKRKQFNNKVNAKKFKPNYRNNNGGQGPNSQRDQQRDFARDYIDFETFDDFNDSSSRSFYPPQQRPMGMLPAIPPYPYRDSRPLLPLPPVPPMYGPGPGPRRPLHPPPMPPHHMRHMCPPMPMMPPRPLLPRPHPAAYGPMRPFGPPGPMRPPRPGMGPRHGQRLMGRGHQGNRAGKRPSQKQHNNNKGNAKKQKKKGGKKITPTPPQELNDMTKPWITDEIREANAKKIELNKLASKAATPDPELWKEFWQAREKVKAMVQAARLEYIGSHPEEDVDKILSEAKTKGEGQNGDAAEIKSESGETKIGNVVCLSQSFVKTDILHTVKSENDNDNLIENGGEDTVIDSCNIKTEPADAPHQGQGDQATVSEVAKNTPAAQAVIKQTPTKAAVKAPPAPVQQTGQVQISKVIPKVQTPQTKPVQGVKPTPATPIKSTPPATAQGKLIPAVQTKTVTIAQSTKPVNTTTAVTKPTTAAPATHVVKPAAAIVKPATPTVVKPATPAVVKPATPTVVKPATTAVVKPAAPAVVKPATPAVAKSALIAVSTPAKVAPAAAKVVTPATKVATTAAKVAIPAAKVVPVTTDVTANVVTTVAAPTEQAKPATASTPKPAVATIVAQPKAPAAVTPAPKAPVQNKTPQNKPQTATRGRGGNAARGGQFNNRGGRANPYNTRTRMTSNDGYNKRGYY